MLFLDVDTAIAGAPVNMLPLIDDGDFKSIEAGVVFNQAGLALQWNFTPTGGATTQTAVTPTTSGDYDWANLGNGMYTIEMPASAGASINNDTEGVGWFTGSATGILPWRGPDILFRAAATNDALIDNTTGLIDAVADGVWDEAMSGHNIAGSAGKYLRQMKEGVVSEEGSVNDAGATTTSFITDLTEATDGHYGDLTLSFIDGALKGQSRIIGGYDGTTKTITFDEALTDAPANGDGFIILTIHNHSITQISAAIWDKLTAVHTTAGTFGKAVADILEDTVEIGVAGAGLTVLATQASVNVIDANVDLLVAGFTLILADTDELQINQGNWLTATGFSTHSASDVYAEFTTGSNEDAFKADVSGLATAAALAVVDGNVDLVKAKTDDMVFTVANVLDVNVKYISDGLTPVNNLDRLMRCLLSGDVNSGTTTTAVDTSRTEADDYWNGMMFMVRSGGNVNTGRIISDWDQGTNTFTFAEPFPAAFSSSDDYVIMPLAVPSKSDINAQVVDVLFTDTIPELAQAQPAATPSIAAAMMLLYMDLRNLATVTATEKAVSDDAGTVIAKKTLSDDSTTYTETKMVSGP